jgi:tetratricopeptide (TPR) repeat protein
MKFKRKQKSLIFQNFESNNTLDALNMYNKAVVFSPNSDDNLARACAERASCLLRLGDYARALADIEQAGVANSPVTKYIYV